MKVAIFTMVYNEAIFLPMWLSHYGDQFGRENLFVVDVGTTDRSTDGLDVNIVKVPRSLLDEERRTSFVRHFHASLLSYYDVVIFCDTDEFFVADPAHYPDMIACLTHREEPIIAGIGLNVIHIVASEPEILPGVPILEQRKYAQFYSLYCKPLIGRQPIDWTPGFHACNGPYNLCQDLYLFHLKSIDKTMFLNELDVKRQAGMSDAAVEKGHGVQLRMSDAELSGMYFPIDAGNIGMHLTGDFKFTDDLKTYMLSGFRGMQSSRGAVAQVPERFRRSLPAYPEARR